MGREALKTERGKRKPGSLSRILPFWLKGIWAHYTKRKKLYAKPHEEAPWTVVGTPGTPTGRRGLNRP
jgi:hypothetical protein